jgi:hypothetical protein
MVIYIAGPMRGVEYLNFAAFDRARDHITSQGHVVISPADLDRKAGFDGREPDDVPDPRECMLRDLHAIADAAEAIAMLPGWEFSRGAAVEAAFASYLGLPILDSATLDPL